MLYVAESCPVADITNVDGKTDTQNAWKGTSDTNRCHNFLWPLLQISLGVSHWHVWRSALSKCLADGNSVNDQRLCLPLGPWTQPVSSKWRWFHCPLTQCLYHYQQQEWTEYLQLPNQRSTHQRKFSQGDKCMPPTLLQLASCQQQKNCAYLLSHSTPFSPAISATTSAISTLQ
jgi:hypothetical protein